MKAVCAANETYMHQVAGNKRKPSMNYLPNSVHAILHNKLFYNIVLPFHPFDSIKQGQSRTHDSENVKKVNVLPQTDGPTNRPAVRHMAYTRLENSARLSF